MLGWVVLLFVVCYVVGVVLGWGYCGIVYVVMVFVLGS